MPAGNNENEFDHEYIYKPLSLSLVFKIMLVSDWSTETYSDWVTVKASICKLILEMNLKRLKSHIWIALESKHNQIWIQNTTFLLMRQMKTN